MSKPNILGPNALSDEAVQNYVNIYKQSHPNLFAVEGNEKALEEIVRNLVWAAGSVARERLTALISNGVLEYAKRDLDGLLNNGISPEIKSVLDEDFNAGISAIVASTWELSLKLIEDIGYYGIDVNKALAESDKEQEEVIKFTSNVVGQA